MRKTYLNHLVTISLTITPGTSLPIPIITRPNTSIDRLLACNAAPNMSCPITAAPRLSIKMCFSPYLFTAMPETHGRTKFGTAYAV